MTEPEPFLSPKEPATLYAGKVMHARLKPKPHRFVYDVFSLLIDLDALPEAAAISRLFSVDRPNLVSFFQRDHGAGDDRPLASHARGLLRRAGLDPDHGRILLLCYPRILGYVFNPLATYWCYDAEGRLEAVIYEVTNTFRERHAYVAAVRAGEVGPAGLRQSRDKLMYVSPFLDMGMRYDFRLRPPGAGVRLRILESDSEGPVLSATFAGERQPFTGRSLFGLCARMPLMTLKVTAAIHWEAARLWMKGIALAEHPAPPAAASFDGPAPAGRGHLARRPTSPIRRSEGSAPR